MHNKQNEIHFVSFIIPLKPRQLMHTIQPHLYRPISKNVFVLCTLHRRNRNSKPIHLNGPRDIFQVEMKSVVRQQTENTCTRNGDCTNATDRTTPETVNKALTLTHTIHTLTAESVYETNRVGRERRPKKTERNREEERRKEERKYVFDCMVVLTTTHYKKSATQMYWGCLCISSCLPLLKLMVAFSARSHQLMRSHNRRIERKNKNINKQN